MFAYPYFRLNTSALICTFHKGVHVLIGSVRALDCIVRALALLTIVYRGLEKSASSRFGTENDAETPWKMPLCNLKGPA